MRPILITFSGIDGAGKSTQIEKLCDCLEKEQISVRHLTFWDDVAVLSRARSEFSRRVLQSDGAIGTPEKPADRRDKNKQGLLLLLGRCLLYVLDVIHLRRVVGEARMSRDEVIIFDRYIYDQLAALPLHRFAARAFARVLLKIVPEPELAYVLDAVPEEARTRKPEYPLDFMRKYRQSYLELRSLAGLQLIPAGTPEDVYQEIVNRFQRIALERSPEAVFTVSAESAPQEVYATAPVSRPRRMR